jgi:hypothetical protein
VEQGNTGRGNDDFQKKKDEYLFLQGLKKALWT